MNPISNLQQKAKAYDDAKANYDKAVADVAFRQQQLNDAQVWVINAAHLRDSALADLQQSVKEAQS